MNGQNQSEIWSQFRMAQRAHIKVSRVDQHHLEGEINHYAGQAWSHKRIFDVHPNQLIIEDFIVAEEVISSVMYLHCHHNVGTVDLDFEKSKINIAGMQLLILGAHKIVIEDMDEALDFNVYVKSKLISISFEKQIKTIITWHD
ncbi:MAG: heparinase II/III family protein [Saprospiraceae bacterium]|nr:heparinase II/III family protein [Saprospiraceae bacterium]